MKLKMHSNSLFAVLLRSPWWVAGLAAAGAFGVTRLFLPGEFAFFAALPFMVIAVYVAWQQLRAPSRRSVAATLERVRAMSWDEFSAAIETCYRRDGYEVKRTAGGADFHLVKDGRNTLVACKRWKATRTGIEPLRDLDGARKGAECIYVATGDVTDQACAFAADKAIRVLEGAELAQLMKT